MLRVNRLKVCESLQGIFRYKHVSCAIHNQLAAMTNNVNILHIDNPSYRDKAWGSVGLVSVAVAFVIA